MKNNREDSKMTELKRKGRDFIEEKVNVTILQTLMRIQFMMLTFQIAEVPSLTKNICIICGDFGRTPKLWRLCRMCSLWAHSECRGSNSPKGYICDFYKERN
jgi:hypothetical protein